MNSERFPFSRIACEEDDCVYCRAWFFAQDDVHCALSCDPLCFGWLRARYQWGPISWPVRWRDLAEASTIDCGVFADVVETLLKRRGVPCARIQWIGKAKPCETKRWADQWESSHVPHGGWILDDVSVYHELLVVELDGEAVFYDTTKDRMLDSESGEVEILRIRLCEPFGGEVLWGGVPLVCGEWVDVSAAR